MREAIGNSLLLSIVVFFVGLIIVFFVGILSYSKAYKVKNRIVEIIEKYETYEGNIEVENEIISSLSEMGYQLGSCKDPDAYNGNVNNSGYKYCIYRIDTEKEGQYYYKVTTYVQFYFPIVGEWINPPVTSETKIFGKTYRY